jgi:hypothetical protein
MLLGCIHNNNDLIMNLLKIIIKLNSIYVTKNIYFTSHDL